jgi:hypothetical protein
MVTTGAGSAVAPAPLLKIQSLKRAAVAIPLASSWTAGLVPPIAVQREKLTVPVMFGGKPVREKPARVCQPHPCCALHWLAESCLAPSDKV